MSLGSLLRDRLTAAQARLAALDDVHPEAGPRAGGLAAQALQDHEARIADRARVQAEIRAVTEALDRLPSGLYGRCADCGEWIKPKRLRALPLTLTCLDCQVLREQAGASAHGEPDDVPDVRPSDELG